MSTSNSSTSNSEQNRLLNFLRCEALDLKLFRGQSKEFKTGQVDGGQVLGQAIKAAYQTILGAFVFLRAKGL